MGFPSPPALALWCRPDARAPSRYVCIDLDCKIGFLWRTNCGRQKMRSLFALGDASCSGMITGLVPNRDL
ncbi:hypothetical protein STH1834 [Symbiobacterium thermophilum IAM 14863]|uniref:Uncharacterized protein n=1 Tax=Symbiobacterium thermophilum (strain DSM 24528 / JCM 14929 / IAM 14863 / T) TaxID=292459 RepID=Q67NC4_SYMTH|nr:hypothetical protein STH1834 [Symbiobacterium thermophilum IAM 14863]